MKRWSTLLLVALLALLARPLAAQEQAAPLEQFLRRAAYLWEAKDVDSLVDLVVETEPVVLDTGRGTESVSSRHVAAALRALFSDRESLSVRPVRAAISGGQPLRGFGQLAWAFRARGAPAAQSRSVYLGAVWTGRGWRINELRLMP